MGAKPVIEITPPGGHPLAVVVTRRLEVGRECDGVLIDDLLLSRQHLAVWPEGDQVVVEDLGSRNGSHLDGGRLRARHVLSTGQVVRAGDTEIRLSDLVVGASAPVEGTRTAHRETMARAPTADDGPQGTVGPQAPSGGSDVRATRIEAVARQVVDDRATLDQMAEAAPRTGGTLTFLFSDIESSTQRAEAMGDHAWYRCLQAHNALVEAQVAHHSGTVVKAVGDGYMITFPSARSAVQTAIGVQRDLDRQRLGDAADPIRVRIGLHTGEAVEADGDLFGLHVNVAARVANQAGGGQILVSALTRAITHVSGDLRFGPEQQVALKGLAGTYGVCELHWREGATEAGSPTVVTHEPPPARAGGAGRADAGPEHADADLRATTTSRPQGDPTASTGGPSGP